MALRGSGAVLAAVMMVSAAGVSAGDAHSLPPSEKQDAMPALVYPATRALPLVEEKFGVKIADPYRWLENDVRTDAQVERWVAAENKVTDAYHDTLPGRDVGKTRM